MTTRQLALLAKVSPATISMALHNHPRVSAATRARIVRLAKKFNYRVDGRIGELMRTIRAHSPIKPKGCLGLVSLYPEERPWEMPGRLSLQNHYRGMVTRAAELGYRIEPIWVRQPGMRLSRLRTIIETRGIQGLLCLGGPNLDEPLPEELHSFAIVSVGVSLSTRLHRVVTHFAQNTTRVLTTLKARGYRRPAAVLKSFEDGRTAHLVAGMYLYFANYVFAAPPIPIFYSDLRIDDRAFGRWFRRYRPDVIVYCEHAAFFPQLEAFFAKAKLQVPDDIGLAGIDCAAHPDWLSGVRQKTEHLGVSAVDMLVGRVQQRDFGLPYVAKVEFVEGEWVEGRTLRRAST
jgi:LacI family transcriptional regulator